MTLKAHEAIQWVIGDLGGDPDGSEIAVLNDAGAHLVGMHTWAWCEQTALLDAVAGQDYVGLPANFRGLLEVNDNGANSEVVKTTSSVLVKAQNSYLGTSFPFMARVRHATVGGNVIPRLYLHPTPTTSTAGQFTLLYLAGWTEVANPASEIPIPYWLRSLYRECAVAFARGYKENRELQGAGAIALQLQLQAIRDGETFRVAREWDAGSNIGGGQMRGGMVDTYNRGVYSGGARQLYDVSIADPT